MSLVTGLILILGGIILIIILTSWLRINSFLSLFIVSLLMALIVLPVEDIVPALKKGFGDTMASIGLIIVFGAVIGVTLDITGATLSMANFILKKTGNRNASLSMTLTGFITGLPIFCDSGFIVLSGLNRSLTARSRLNPVFMSSVLACSLYSVHCLIPPHPGATAAAGIIGAGIGQLVLAGLAVAIPATVTGYLWSRFISRRVKTKTDSNSVSEIKESFSGNLPAPGRSFVPIVVPLLMITFGSLSGIIFIDNSPAFVRISAFAGDPVIALMTGMFLSFLLLPVFRKDTINQVLSAAIEKAGPIIIITAAGGIFGAIIRETGTGEQAGEFLSRTNLGLFIPFLLAFILKTAQGSSTVAVITAASIMAPMMTGLGFSGSTDTLLVMLAMGAGSMMVSHANDSYFWVITNFSKIDAGDTLRVYSTSTFIMGITSFAAVLLLSVFL